MNSEKIILHIDSMLSRLEPEALRAVYMVVKELDTLSGYKNKIS